VVNIWASDCAPCKKELPLFELASRSAGLKVIGISRDVSRLAAARALARSGITYPNWIDTEAAFAVALDGRVPINAVPASVLIRDGQVIAVHVGAFQNLAEVVAMP
jgi:thiol-disulfide isomerase/thioredoxin